MLIFYVFFGFKIFPDKKNALKINLGEVQTGVSLIFIFLEDLITSFTNLADTVNLKAFVSLTIPTTFFLQKNLHSNPQLTTKFP